MGSRKNEKLNSPTYNSIQSRSVGDKLDNAGVSSVDSHYTALLGELKEGQA